MGSKERELMAQAKAQTRSLFPFLFLPEHQRAIEGAFRASGSGAKLANAMVNALRAPMAMGTYTVSLFRNAVQLKSLAHFAMLVIVPGNEHHYWSWSAGPAHYKMCGHDGRTMDPLRALAAGYAIFQAGGYKVRGDDVDPLENAHLMVCAP